MTLRLLTCFSLLVLVAPAASVTGVVAVTDAKATGNVSPDRSGAVVWLEPLPDAPPNSIHRPSEKARMVQKNKTFLPHVLAIPVGSSVDFPNFDPIFHNAFSNYDGQPFDVGLYPPGSSRTVVFRRAGVVRVFCNIHSFMSAIIVVLRSSLFTVSGPDGSFQIDDVPEGAYRLQFYYERATEQTLSSLARTVEVTGPTLPIGVVTISESGYLPLPHKNKYGKAYGPNPDGVTYPGARP